MRCNKSSSESGIGQNPEFASIWRKLLHQLVEPMFDPQLVTDVIFSWCSDLAWSNPLRFTHCCSSWAQRPFEHTTQSTLLHEQSHLILLFSPALLSQVS